MSSQITEGQGSEPAHYGNLLDHEYDGIREYDNPTPGWWHMIFLGTIIFSVLYIVFWHFSPASWTVQEAWAERQAKEDKKMFGSIKELKPDAETIFGLMKDEKMMNVAGGLFAGNCVQCHGPDGGAGGGAYPGVNLTDDSYKNVRDIAGIFTVITKGANNGAMPAWESRLGQNERILLAAYAARLRGRTAKDPKPAEGEVIPPWSVGPAATSDPAATAPAAPAPAAPAATPATPAPGGA